MHRSLGRGKLSEGISGDLWCRANALPSGLEGPEGVGESASKKPRGKSRLSRTSSIKDVQKAGLIVDGDLLTVGVLNGGIVLVNEVVLDKLDGKSRLSDTSAACSVVNQVLDQRSRCSETIPCFLVPCQGALKGTGSQRLGIKWKLSSFEPRTNNNKLVPSHFCVGSSG